jgi:hypothetical protein
MKKHTRYIVAVFVLALCGGAAFAQMSPERVVANVPFAFYVGKTELPAGQYEIYPESNEAFDLVIRNLSTGKVIVVPVLTWIKTGEADKAELVFNKVDDKSYLAEVHPAQFDGYELIGSPVKHSHGTVKTS